MPNNRNSSNILLPKCSRKFTLIKNCSPTTFQEIDLCKVGIGFVTRKIQYPKRPWDHPQVAYESRLNTHTWMRSTAGSTGRPSRGARSGKSPRDCTTAVRTIHQLRQTWHKVNQAGLKKTEFQTKDKTIHIWQSPGRSLSQFLYQWGRKELSFFKCPLWTRTLKPHNIL